MKKRKEKGISICVDKNYYFYLENERKKLMKKLGLNRLTTKDATKILSRRKRII